MKAILRVNFEFLAQGTVLRKDCDGNYFVSLPDEDLVRSPINRKKITVDGHYVESHPEIFELIEKQESKTALLRQALELLNGLTPTNHVVQDAIKKINLAMQTAGENEV